MQNIETIRHSLAHVLAMAIKEIYPKTKLGIGPAIENGFYYDFDFPTPLKPEDLKKIEQKMRELLAQDIKFKKSQLSKIKAKNLFKGQTYKLELIKELPGKTVSIYESGNFVDLCKGPHIKSTKEIPSDGFKLTKTAGAYWKGSEKNKMLTRIYGVAFATKKETDDYLKLQEEAARRDHRILGEKMEMFMVDEKIGKGLPIWLPNGYFIRRKMEDYMYEIEKENGYIHVLTPILAKEELYKKSGHLAHYKDDMYAPIDIEGEKYYLKPMNCPHHHSVYLKKPRSYRELPMRIAEFGHVHRFERSGVLSGMTRVRGFTQNDSHIYCYPDCMEKEILNILQIFKRTYQDFDITDYWFRLSLPDFKNKEKYGDIKNKDMWQKGADDLRNALKKVGISFKEVEGEASFYGPKIDIQIKDVWGKEDTIATIQVDYYSAGKFDLFYTDNEGKKQPVVIIHRAILGSFERFFAFLLEKTSGAMPLWLSPVQISLIPISEKHSAYAKKVYNELIANNIRVELKDENETLSKKIRESEGQKVPYVLVVGDKEIADDAVAVRKRGEGDKGMKKISDFIKEIKGEINSKLT